MKLDGNRANSTRSRRRKVRRTIAPQNIETRWGPPLAPVTISRLPVFAPRRRRDRQERSVTIPTPWGTVTVTGRLTQIHRHLLDCALATAIGTEELGGGAMRLVVDPYTLTRAMGTSTWDYNWLEGLLRDLRRAEVRIVEHGHAFPLAVSGILNDFGRYDRQKRLRPGLVSHRPDDRRDMIYLVASAAWWSMWQDRPLAHYRDLLPALGHLTGLSQAIARLCLTQRDGWKIGVAKALAVVGAWADTNDAHSPEARRNRRLKATLQAEADPLARLGITLDGEVLTYHRPRGAFVEPVRDGK